MTKMPLNPAGVEAHDGEMTTDLLLRSASQGTRPWDRWLARVRAPFLDAQLAAGCPPRTGRILAIRAERIASPAGRMELAERWGRVLDQARRAPVPRTPRAPLCRDRVVAAESDIQAMLAVLVGPLPV